MFVPSAGAITAPQISINYEIGCALIDTGTVTCAGDNSDGELGLGVISVPPERGTHAPVPGLTDIIQLAAGEDHMCALKADRTVLCWGDNAGFQLGRGGVSTTDSGTPAPVVDLSGVTQIASQDQTVCALLLDTSVRCWGGGTMGQLGNGSSSNSSTPVQPTGLTGVIRVVPGDQHTCAVLATGGLKCWGDDSFGQLGNGPGNSSSATPVDVPGLTGVVDVGAGDKHSCALTSGRAFCWGDNDEGQTADPSLLQTNSPRDVGIADVQTLAVGYDTNCVIVAGGGVKCWGRGDDGQLGDGQAEGANTDSAVPLDVPAAAGAVMISQQFDETPCTVYQGGGVKCWGYNSDGQTGVSLAPPGEISTPTAVPGLDLVTLAHPAASTAAKAKSKPKVDRRKRNYSLTTDLAVGLQPFVAPTEACTGTASVSVKYRYTTIKKSKGKRKKVRRTKTVRGNATMAPVGATCTGSKTLKLPVKYLNRKTVTVNVAFAGNGALAAFNTSYKQKLPKVRIKKKR